MRINTVTVHTALSTTTNTKIVNPEIINLLPAIYIFLFSLLMSATALAEDSATKNMPAAPATEATTTAKESENATQEIVATPEQATEQSAGTTDTGQEMQAQDQIENVDTAATEKNEHIARAQFSTAIVDREPTDNIETITNDNEKIYFFTEFVNLSGTTVTHRWEYEGKTMAEVNFNVGGNRWRVYSIKTIHPEWTGSWSVVVVDDQGTVLNTSTLEVVETNSAQ